MRTVALILLGIFLLPAIGFILLIIKLARKTARSAWKGTVVEKLSTTARRDTDNPKHISQFRTLVVRTDDGATRKVAVTKEIYDSCAVGDKLEKPVGKLNPVKL